MGPCRLAWGAPGVGCGALKQKSSEICGRCRSAGCAALALILGLMLLGWRAAQESDVYMSGAAVRRGRRSAWKGQAKALRLRRPASAGCRSDAEAEAPKCKHTSVPCHARKCESEPKDTTMSLDRRLHPRVSQTEA